MNAEFHSAATRPMDAYDHDRLTACRGLFLVLFSVPHPFSAADPHWPLPSKVPAFPHGNAGTRRRLDNIVISKNKRNGIKLTKRITNFALIGIPIAVEL